MSPTAVEPVHSVTEEKARLVRRDFASDSATPSYAKANVISLRDHRQFNEAWVKERIIADLSILGLGNNLAVRAVEKIQPKAGRLDLLLSDGVEGIRYEVELMVGEVDPSHIIRTLEYWDIERKRYPDVSHIAVLIAEKITGRFLNVISLFNGAIPFIAIQMTALVLGDHVTLQFTKVLDVIERGEDDAEIDRLPQAFATQIILVSDLGLINRQGKRGRAIRLIEECNGKTVAEYKTKLAAENLPGYAGWALDAARNAGAISLGDA